MVGSLHRCHPVIMSSVNRTIDRVATASAPTGFTPGAGTVTASGATVTVNPVHTSTVTVTLQNTVTVDGIALNAAARFVRFEPVS